MEGTSQLYSPATFLSEKKPPIAYLIRWAPELVQKEVFVMAK
jgi:hypothetical protein